MGQGVEAPRQAGEDALGVGGVDASGDPEAAQLAGPGRGEQADPVPIPRSAPSEGSLTSAASGSPGARATMVVDPPPSRLMASSAPMARMNSAKSGRFSPRLSPDRPSTATRNSVRPSALTPAPERGAGTTSVPWPASPSRRMENPPAAAVKGAAASVRGA